MIFQNESNLDFNKLIQIDMIETSHKKAIYKMIFIEKEAKIVTASEDCKICIWFTQTGELYKTLVGHTDRIWNLIELKDGRFVL